jgi:hypothetical protein
MLGRGIGHDLIASLLQTTFHRGPEGRIVVDNMHNPRHEFLLKERERRNPKLGLPQTITQVVIVRKNRLGCRYSSGYTARYHSP